MVKPNGHKIYKVVGQLRGEEKPMRNWNIVVHIDCIHWVIENETELYIGIEMHSSY